MSQRRTRWPTHSIDGTGRAARGSNVVATVCRRGDSARVIASAVTCAFWALLAANVGVVTIESIRAGPGGGTPRGRHRGLSAVLVSFGVPKSRGWRTFSPNTGRLLLRRGCPGWFADVETSRASADFLDSCAATPHGDHPGKRHRLRHPAADVERELAVATFPPDAWCPGSCVDDDEEFGDYTRANAALFAQ